MLTFEEKLAIIASFPELERKQVSLGRLNFHYEASEHDKKIVVYHLHPNGNGFVYAGHLPKKATDEKGFVNIRDYSAEELRSIIEASIQFLSTKPEPITAAQNEPETNEERWVNPQQQILLLMNEEDLWNVYVGLNLEASFTSRKEAEQYLEEEGFTRQS